MSLLFFNTAPNQGDSDSFTLKREVWLNKIISLKCSCFCRKVKDGQLCLFCIYEPCISYHFCWWSTTYSPCISSRDCNVSFRFCTFTPLNVMNVYMCAYISKLCNTKVSLIDVEGTVVCSNTQGYQHYCALYTYCSLFLV